MSTSSSKFKDPNAGDGSKNFMFFCVPTFYGMYIQQEQQQQHYIRILNSNVLSDTNGQSFIKSIRK